MIHNERWHLTLSNRIAFYSMKENIGRTGDHCSLQLSQLEIAVTLYEKKHLRNECICNGVVLIIAYEQLM